MKTLDIPCPSNHFKTNLSLEGRVWDYKRYTHFKLQSKNLSMSSHNFRDDNWSLFETKSPQGGPRVSSSDLPRTKAVPYKEDCGKVGGDLNFGEPASGENRSHLYRLRILGYFGLDPPKTTALKAFKAGVEALGILNHLGQVVQDILNNLGQVVQDSLSFEVAPLLSLWTC